MKIKPHEEFAIWRRRRDYSQGEVAARFNISQGYISHMEQGLRPVPKKIKAEMPKTTVLKECDEFFIRMRRMGLNMNLAVELFGVTHQKLLQYIRNEIPVKKELWEKLETDEAKYAAYRENEISKRPKKKH